MVFRIGWISMGWLLCEFGEKPASITESGARRQTRRAVAYSECCSHPVGAGSPANTGKAGAIHRVAFFAGKPAPTRNARCSR